MQIDVLKLITPDLSVVPQGFAGLSGSTPNYTYVGPKDVNGIMDLVYMKGKDVNPKIPGGYPWDWLKVGDQFIHQLLTENAWSDPSTGKMLLGLGARRFPRWIEYSPNQPAGAWAFTNGRPETDYIIFGPGGVPIGRNTDAIVRNTFRGPYPGPAIGQLPAGLDWFLDYEWAGKMVNGVLQFGVKETVKHRQGWGRYGWESYTAVSGVYQATPNQQSATTSIILGIAPVPVQKIF